MEYVLDILQRIKEKPACFLGRKSVLKLSILLCGYIQAIEDVTHEKIRFNSEFQRFIEDKYEYSGKHWSRILEEKYSDSEGFDKFFEHFDEFIEQFM